MQRVKRGLSSGIKNPYKPLSDGTVLKALNNLGYEGKATVHGFRDTFSIMANEVKGIDKDAGESRLATGERSGSRTPDHRSEYLEERTGIMQWWADWLEAIEREGKVLPPEDYLP